ncbi:MFS transporter, partial [Chlamydiales bacterium]|nr:MFS transporter [Chlamydiales bacterium]
MLRWVIWGCSVLFFFYEFFLRISPSVMVSELMRDFHVNSEALGNLSAYYFYIYAPMQIPVGILMDRFGARRLMTLAVLSCGLGGVLFGMANALSTAEFARVLMGFGSSFAFVSMIFIASHWLPTKYLAILIGIGNSFGMAGAFGGEGPLSIAVENFGWRMTSIAFGVAGIVFAFIIYLLFRGVELPEKIKHLRAKSLGHAFKSFKEVLHNRETWLIALVSLMFYLTTAA